MPNRGRSSKRLKLAAQAAAENEVDQKADKGDRGHDDPEGLFSGGAEIPQGRVDHRPGGQQHEEDKDTTEDKNFAHIFISHRALRGTAL